MSTYVRITWWHRAVSGLALVATLGAIGVAVHQNASARSWRNLERQRAMTAHGQLADLRDELAELRKRTESAESTVAELANDQAQTGDVAAQLEVLTVRAATADQALARCLPVGALDEACGVSLLEARSVLRALQNLQER